MLFIQKKINTLEVLKMRFEGPHTTLLEENKPFY